MFVVNCNLQRLDGPVRGNGRIIDELETLYAGAGWNVIKLVWGSDWDALLRRDATGALARAFANTVDGQFQTFAANDGAFNRAHFFNQNPELAALDVSIAQRFGKARHAYDDATAKIFSTEQWLFNGVRDQSYERPFNNPTGAAELAAFLFVVMSWPFWV